MDSRIRQYLIDNGMRKQYVDGNVAERVVDLMLRYMASGASGTIDSALEIKIKQRQQEVSELDDEIRQKKDTLGTIIGIEDEYKGVLSQKAKEVVAMYNTLINIGVEKNADPDVSVRNAGFIMYAYLGGKAKAIITNGESCDDYNEDDYWDD